MASDRDLIQIVDAALAEATLRSGNWLACRPGCAQCCTGAFVINALDAARIQTGLAELRERDGPRANALMARTAVYVERTRKDFPGNPDTGILFEDAASQESFAAFADDEVCPVLDPTTATCDLYPARPMTCRVFGPPVRGEEGLAVCELCFVGADPETIAQCELVADPDDLEAALLEESTPSETLTGSTIVAYALQRTRVE